MSSTNYGFESGEIGVELVSMSQGSSSPRGNSHQVTTYSSLNPALLSEKTRTESGVQHEAHRSRTPSPIVHSSLRDGMAPPPPPTATVTAMSHMPSPPSTVKPKQTSNIAGIIQQNGGSAPEFEVSWSQLSYLIPKGIFGGSSQDKKYALDNVSGSLTSGQLVALIGPSGSGKTVLLECLIGMRVKGVTGSVEVTKKRKRLKVAFVPQSDHLHGVFTVFETLVYASRLKNTTGRIDHEKNVEQIISDLGLAKCRDNRVSKCSGGQQKRITIAQELVSHPQILVLDEPTSGLDSTLCYQAMDLLKSLVNKSLETSDPMAIVTVIHQPPAKVFNMFDKVLFFTSRGQCCYEGDPMALVPTLQEIGSPPPDRYNPADYAVEIAAYEYGAEPVNALVDIQNRKRPNRVVRNKNELVKAMKIEALPFFYHLWIILSRSSSMVMRDPVLTGLRLLASTVIPLFFNNLFGTDIGNYPGCPDFKKSILSMDHDELLKMAEDKARYEWEEQIYSYTAGFLACNLVVYSYSGVLISILSFPLEFRITMREHFNGWYGTPAYFLGRIIAELPLMIICPIITSGIAYWGTSQPDDWFRFALFTITIMMVFQMSYGLGILSGAIFADNLLAAIFMTPIVIMPMLVFSGFYTRVYKLPLAARYMADISFIRYSFEAMLVSFYGYGRCVCDFDTPQDDKIGDWVTCLALNTREPPVPPLCTQNGHLPETLNNTCSGGPRAVGSCGPEYKPIMFMEFNIDESALIRGWSWISGEILLTLFAAYMVILYRLRSK